MHDLHSTYLTLETCAVKIMLIVRPPSGQHELDHTDHTDHTDLTDLTDRKHVIYLLRKVCKM